MREYLERFEQAGVDQVIFVLQAGKNRHEHICESLELFGREVLPAFKDRDEAQVRAKTARLGPIVEAAMDRRAKRVPAASTLPAGLLLPGDAPALGRRDGQRGDAGLAGALRRRRAKGIRDEGLGILGG